MSLPSKTRDVVAYIVLNRSATYSSAAKGEGATHASQST
jgi:hypothetical protein